ncbi:MAG: tripartite tricarboxylate transporter substrate binding protein [Candidatus Protistobacter heckmanni]|nr:tripartite tricarboxylate transporter substrate binding protein [Candidatus Protistobacter heckmanni]
MKRRTLFGLLAAVAAVAAAQFCASAALAQQDYPSKPIKLIVPFPPGGISDTISRAIGSHLQTAFGQPVVVDNRPGAGGNVGLGAAAKSPSDGYTIALGATTNLAVSPFLYKGLNFDARKDLTPVAMIGTIPNVLIINKSIPANNLKEFVAYLKANPGAVNFASPGAGNSSHLSGEMFKQRMGVDIRHVPYKGDPPALTDLVGGHVQMMFATVGTALPHIKTGAVKALVVAGPNRSAALPGVPSMADLQIENFDTDAWFGIVVPAGTPAAIVAKLNQAVNAAVNDPDINARLVGMGLRPSTMSSAAFAGYVQHESVKWGQLVQLSGATVD